MARPYNARAARRARRKIHRLQGRIHRLRQAEHNANNAYDPLAPLTGKRLRQERKAAQRLQFGGETATLRQQTADQAQTTADRAQYYDDYRQALRESTARINAVNAANVQAEQARADAAYNQDKADLAARDAAASEQAAKLGRGLVQSAEGAQAVSAERSQANLAINRSRDQGAADTKYLELRGATAALAKTEDQTRQQRKADQLRAAARDLAQRKGAFRVDFTRKAREDERQYAAIKKEFGLKERQLGLDATNARKSRALEKQKLRTQKAIANIYASADKQSAQAQVRIARINLRKGRITRSQYRKIVNVYRGLGHKTVDVNQNITTNGGHGGGGAGGQGSGTGGSLAPWERDKVSDAVYSLRKHSAKLEDKRTWIRKMQERGIPLRLARIAWRRYAKSNKGSSRPDTAGNPNVAGH